MSWGIVDGDWKTTQLDFKDHRRKISSGLKFLHLLNDPFYQYLGDKVKWKLRRITGHYRLKLDQININGQSFGQDGWVHHDRPDDRHLGLLLFASPTWDRDWGGEFVVYDIFDRPTYVNNIPNRAVLFPPNFDHRGVAPSRKSTALRVTMVFFFEKI
jgi:hypothetical protein